MENEKGEILSPQNIDEMNDEEFNRYIESAETGEYSPESPEGMPGKEFSDGRTELYSLMNELKRLQSENDYQRRVDDIQNEWRRQESILKNIVPDFDLETAFENPDFYEAVTENHMSITEAYPILKRQKYNISEIGNLTSGVGGYVKRDVASMSDTEFDDYIKKIKNN